MDSRQSRQTYRRTSMVRAEGEKASGGFGRFAEDRRYRYASDILESRLGSRAKDGTLQDADARHRARRLLARARLAGSVPRAGRHRLRLRLTRGSRKKSPAQRPGKLGGNRQEQKSPKLRTVSRHNWKEPVNGVTGFDITDVPRVEFRAAIRSRRAWSAGIAGSWRARRPAGPCARLPSE